MKKEIKIPFPSVEEVKAKFSLKDPLAVHFMTDDEYVLFCMGLWQYSQGDLRNEAAFFRANDIEWDSEVKSHCVALIKAFKRGEKIDQTRLGETLLQYITQVREFVANTNGQSKKLNAPAIALFCNWVNGSKLMKMEFSEGVESYCTRVCRKYNLEYSDKVRQAFNRRDIHTDRNWGKVTQLILPSLEEKDRKQIFQYLNNQTKIFG